MRDHRSLIAWQEARALALDVISLSRTKWRPWAAAMFTQLQRSSLSVQLNVAEGYSYAQGRTGLHLLRVAWASAVETGDLLELLGDSGVIDAAVTCKLKERNQLVQKLVWGMIRAHQSTRRNS
jgi:four helix bundle protein